MYLKIKQKGSMNTQSLKTVSRISALRKQANLTQAQLAVLIGVTPQTIQNWEKGSSGINLILKFIKLCIILDCSLLELIDFVPSDDVSEKAGDFSVESLRQLKQAWNQSTQTSSQNISGPEIEVEV